MKSNPQQRLAIINVVGLCPRLVTESDTPFIHQFCQESGRSVAKIKPVLPAVTSTMQATFLTGKTPAVLVRSRIRRASGLEAIQSFGEGDEAVGNLARDASRLHLC